MKPIRLTTMSGDAIYVNPDYIVHFGEGPGKKGSCVCLDRKPGGSVEPVREPPEKIMRLLEKAEKSHGQKP